jgi:MoCo/4Fe-4S cofactor protein with predicted Tat translocation signal
MENTKRYWKGIEELQNTAEFVKNAHREFPDMPSQQNQTVGHITDGTGSHRRDFLKVLGFSVAAVSLAACETPVRKAVPYLNKPEDVEPTIADWYASTYTDGGDYASILVKTREGRPIKIEGNPLSSITQGGLSARAHASLLSLYDNEKLKGPQKDGKSTDWASIDKEIGSQLAAIAAKDGQIRIVSNTILSPSTKAVISAFSAKYSNTKHVVYDANSASGLQAANGGIIPSYDFSKANVIVGLSCDFLGTWLSSTEFSKQYAVGRKLSSAKEGKKTMSRHYQFESILSLTGSNADYRAAHKPSQEGAVAVALYNAVAKLTGGTSVSGGDVKIDLIAKAAKDLVAAKGAALVVSGSNDLNIQMVVNSINGLLSSYGATINTGTPMNVRQGNDADMTQFIQEVKSGAISAVIFYNANPVYNHPKGQELGDALKRVALTVSTNDRADETGALCKYNTPDSHALESWNDAEPKRGFYSICQPTITTIFQTRQAQTSLLTWAGNNTDYGDFLENNWKNNIAKGANWSQILHDGVYEVGGNASFNVPTMNVAAAAQALSAIKGAEMEFVAYEKVGMGTGSQANNPWLQEFPEPVSKACWDNYASVSQATAKKLGIKSHEVVEVEVAGKKVSLPALVQPGQADDTVAIAIGYGRTNAGKAANGVGVNVYPMMGSLAAKVTPTGQERIIAQTQTHETVMARESVIQETVLSAYVKNHRAGRFEQHIHTSAGHKTPTQISLWDGHTRPNHAWGMVIDLNSCTGCSACVVSCQAENNVPVVGRQEVINRREMHWIRIDRYYSSDTTNIQDYAGLEIASANPEVTFQPMMCQHCNNAPCETVCPVLATTHSTEGLNQMTYNRCIGTRYCANNCPYKVRRFNWFKYFDEGEDPLHSATFDFHFNNDLGKMVINPDVTVRSRGVMEKCSMCVQRIQAGKLEAKKERRRPVDGEIKTACSQSCPTGAITFGDMNDPQSQIAQMLETEKEGRSFRVLEEISVLPSVNYLVKVRNKDEVAGEVAHAEAHH